MIKCQPCEDLKAIIRILKKQIKADAAAARIYKKELNNLNPLFDKLMGCYVKSTDRVAGLEKEAAEVWDERNKAIQDYNIIYSMLELSKHTFLPKYKDYEMPNGDPVSDYTLDVEGKLMESGRLMKEVNLIKIPKMPSYWHTKFRKNCFKFSDIRKKKPTKKKEKKHDKESN